MTTSSSLVEIDILSGDSNFTETIELVQPAGYTITDTKILIDANRYGNVRVGDFLKAFVNTSLLQLNEQAKKFTRIIKKQPWVGNLANNVNYVELTTDAKIDIASFGGNLETTRYTTLENYINTYKAITLGGFAVKATSLPDGTEAMQSSILDIVGKNTPLYYAITDKENFNFRYLIDSFGNGLTAFSKQQLADLTGKRKNCIAFLNMPSVKAFKQSANPSFINTDGTLNLDFVKTGGNLDANPTFLYSFADGSGTDDGRDTIGYFFGYCTINDNGRPLSFPPAAFVANTYMRKINSAVTGIYPWTVAAGVEDGLIKGIASTDIKGISELGIESLFAMGANPILFSKTDGYYLANEFTASLNPFSALSFLHVREILIELENELFAMLKKYEQKFNTSDVRAKIKRQADDICQKFKDRDALYDFLNVIDTTNNTAELIDNAFGLLDTFVEPVKAMGRIVNTINVLATGGIKSSGFGLQ